MIQWRVWSLGWTMLVVVGFVGVILLWLIRYTRQVEIHDARVVADEVNVGPRDLSVVDTVAVSIGQRVKAGDELCAFHANAAQQQLLHAKQLWADLQGELAVAKAELDVKRRVGDVDRPRVPVERKSTDLTLRTSRAIVRNRALVLRRAKRLARSSAISEAALNEYKNAYWTAKLSYQEERRRSKRLAARIAHLREEVTIAESAVRLAERRAAAALTLRAPVSGVVERIEVLAGEVVNPSQVAVVIRKAASRVEGLIRESDLGDIRIGQSGEVWLASGTLRPFTGTLTHVGGANPVSDGGSWVHAGTTSLFGTLFGRSERSVRVVLELATEVVDVPNGTTARVVFARSSQ